MNTRYRVRMRREQREWQAKGASAQTASSRWLCNFFQFWLPCTQKPCRRARACRGEPNACFERFWPHVTEETKVWFQAAVTARTSGLSPQEAGRAADAEVERWREVEALVKRLRAQTKAAVPAAVNAAPKAAEPERARSERTGPRVRGL